MHKKNYIKITIFLVILVLITNSYSDILILNSQTFNKAKQQFQFLLVYFYDTQCKQCTETTTLFHTLHPILQQLIHSQTSQQPIPQLSKLQLAQLNFKQNTQTYKKYNITTIPQLIIYQKQNQLSYRYPGIQFNYLKLQDIVIWIKRVISFNIFSQKYIESGNYENGKYVLMNCRAGLLIHKILSSPGYFDHLDINYICVNQSSLGNYNIMLKQNDYTATLSCLYQQQKWKQCQHSINNFKFRGVIHWSQQLINNLYNKNYSIFVLITSNQSLSHQYIKNFSTIKQELDQREFKYKLPIFAIADIHYDINSTIRIKKFVGGYNVKGWPYPLPLLAYLEVDDEDNIIKYVYELRHQHANKTKQSISEWIALARNHQLTKYHRGENMPTQMQQLKKKSRNIIKVFLSQLLILISQLKKPSSISPKHPQIYLYIHWKSNWQMQILLNKTQAWWQQKRYQGYFYSLDLIDNQLPQGIIIKNIPAIVIFYVDGSFNVYENVRNVQDIEKIIYKNNQMFKFGGRI